MSTPDLAAIEARAKAATEGPWEFDGHDIENVPDYTSDNPAPWTPVMECEVDCSSYCYGGSVRMNISQSNREFIAHARTDIPALLALVREQQTKLEANQDRAIQLGALMAYDTIEESALREAEALALEEAALAAEGMHDPAAPDCKEWADWLRARAKTIRGEG